MSRSSRASRTSRSAITSATSRRSRQANIRLARFLVVLSLTTVFGAGFAMQAGAGSNKSVATQSAKSAEFVTVTIAPGESLWSVAKALGDGDPRHLVDEIMTVNGLKSAELPAGTKVRVPLN